MPMRVLCTGATGFLGSAVRRALRDRADIDLRYSTLRSSISDLRDPRTIRDALIASEATHVLHLAFPGSHGIVTAATAPLTLAADCLRIDTNVIEACAQAGVAQLVCVGSVCQYPETRWIEQGRLAPMSELQIFEGAPEPVNAPYGHAKRMQLALLDAAYTQHNLCSVQLVLDNLYGPGDRSGHVIPATVQKCLAAQRAGEGAITAWGDGTATREFVYVDDAAQAIVAALQAEPQPPRPINIVSSQPIAMRELVDRISGLCEYGGEISWDASKPVGQQSRWFSGALAERDLGWTPQTSLMAGLAQTVAWWQSQLQEAQ